METVLIVNTAATCVMTGVIWFVQRVHYPLLAIVGTERAIIVAEQHQRRTGQVVALPMAAEGVTTLLLLLNQPNGVSMILPWIGAVLLAEPRQGGAARWNLFRRCVSCVHQKPAGLDVVQW